MLPANLAVEPWLTLGLLVLVSLSLNLVALSAARLLASPRTLHQADLPADALPKVLIQLPLFNEGDLIKRLLTAVAALDWPRERLQIQVLDDSTDSDALALSQTAVAELARQGFDIQLLHRIDRLAFKAGALAAGLEQSDAVFVAVLDADFVPPRDFLQRTLGVLSAAPDLAYVQARWTHLNRDANLLTAVQARLLDAHFLVEQEVRWRLGLPVPFNGTCGVWRCAAIRDAGGWQGDTLTEDLDLSLRARLNGWRSAFLIDLEVPGVLPESARAWRVQQFRWTKGFVQCFIKLVGPVWRSPALPRWQKLLISLQLLQPLAFATGAASLLLSLTWMASGLSAGPLLSSVGLLAGTVGLSAPLVFLWLAGPATGRYPMLVQALGGLVLTSGLLASNARAGGEALLGRASAFVRTPKQHTGLSAAGTRGYDGLLELGLGMGLVAYALLVAPAAGVYLLLAVSGLISMGILQLRDQHPGLRLALARWRMRPS